MYAALVQPRGFVSAKLLQSAYRGAGTAASLRSTTCMTGCRNLKRLQDLPRHYKVYLLVASAFAFV